MNLRDIRDSFLNRSFDIEGLPLWLGVAVLAACLLLLLLFLIRTIQRRRIRYHPHGSITDPETIRMFLRQAYEQRRPFEVQIHNEVDTRRPNLRTTLEQLGPVNFTVEISGIESFSEQWIGRTVNIFFHVNIDGDPIYYTFQTRIASIHFPVRGVCHLTMEIPTLLENRQKRAFLRLKPPAEFFRGAAMWHGSALPDDSSLYDLTLWPRPTLLFLPGRLEQFEVLNVSAGGMRMRLPHAVVRAQDLHFNSVERVIIMLDLLDPEQNCKLLRYWLQCRVQSVWFEHPSRDLFMGLQFLAWAKPREIPGGHSRSGMEWLRLPSSNEVEPIGNWIMRRHLEIFRDLPVDIR
ncbi:MAG: hypothetical protein LBO77_05470 [Desulfovibrio sp.]|jgi:hypothetical protein|nr:hypothetical protein [Desulfovibrio sp.]